jgi:hypothetical protein
MRALLQCQHLAYVWSARPKHARQVSGVDCHDLQGRKANRYARYYNYYSYIQTSSK